MHYETENLTVGLSPKPQIIPRDELFALLEEGATVVTGNRRLYREIEAEFEREIALVGSLRHPGIGLLPRM